MKLSSWVLISLKKIKIKYCSPFCWGGGAAGFGASLGGAGAAGLAGAALGGSAAFGGDLIGWIG